MRRRGREVKNRSTVMVVRRERKERRWEVGEGEEKRVRERVSHRSGIRV